MRLARFRQAPGGRPGAHDNGLHRHRRFHRAGGASRRLAWNRLLDRHNSLVTDILEEHRGNQIGTTGDGVLATFDGAARAILATEAIRDAVKTLGLEIRSAVHTGELELVPGNLRGIAVHEAARILELAGAGEILVSRTTRELVSGRGFVFVDRGMHRLKGARGTAGLHPRPKWDRVRRGRSRNQG